MAHCPSSSYLEMRREILAKLRPSKREELVDFDEAGVLLRSRSTFSEEVFDKEFAERMRGEYVGRVSSVEKTATDPIWRARSWEMRRYEDSRKGLAEWTTRQVLEDQLYELARRADSGSAPMKVLTAAQELAGEEPVRSSPAPSAAAARPRGALPPAKAQESSTVPTRLRTRLNVFRQNGSIVLTNPVATTSVSGGRDSVSVAMDKDFRKLALRSRVNYGVREACLNVNLNKKITDQVSVDLDHFNYTGDKRGASGEKTKEQARVNYNISF